MRHKSCPCPRCWILVREKVHLRAMETVSLDAHRSRSYSTWTSLYQETRREMDLLNKQNLLKDNIICELKTRLSRHERIRVVVGEGESVVVGPGSKSLLESLCKEVCRLKLRSHDAEEKASQQTEEIQRLNSQLRARDLELEQIQGQPEHEKEQQIQQLRSALQEKERREATRADLCSSLAEEADQLRSQLAATVKVCQELLVRLEEGKTAGEGKQSTESPQRSAVDSQLSQLQDENRQLKQRVAYVQSLNTQWQKYDSSREDYISGLCQRLKDSSSRDVVPGLVSVGAGLLRHEISRLNGLLEEKLEECSRLEREVDDVRRQDRERIQTLEQQVLIYAEDFESERADRERAQSQIHELKEKIHQLKQGGGPDHRDPLCRVHIGHRISRRREAAERVPGGGGIGGGGGGIGGGGGGVARQQTPAATVAQATGLAWSEAVGLSELQCPRCLAAFNDTDAAEYLRHCEDCAQL